ncbi:MAG TPA: NAD(P)-binding domain-containing protein [Candidatus Binataceae bacterium]|nr:NAD(P)-binding domain-containing protein [Candidatus Binataceae bacterium]
MKLRAKLGAAGALAALSLFALLAVHRSYSPGSVLPGHQSFAAQCAACHQPWRAADNGGCAACHGAMPNNPHAGSALDDKDGGLIAGFHLAGMNDQLACLSCHVDHRGALDLPRAAGFACTWCHQHPSLAEVQRHAFRSRRDLIRPYGSIHAFKIGYSHRQHLQLLLKRGAAPACQSCHVVQRASAPAAPARFVLAWSSCAGSGCHLNPQDRYLNLPASVGSAPRFLAYWRMIRLKHLDARFDHSADHLRSACERCHMAIATSTRVGDLPSRQTLNCFSCHAHQPLPERSAPMRRVALGRDVVLAATAGPAPIRAQARTVECTQCHAFHRYGSAPSYDFNRPAPLRSPRMRGTGLQLVLYLPVLSRSGGSMSGFQFQPTTLKPWWLGLLGLLASSLLALVYLRAIPHLVSGDSGEEGGIAPRIQQVPKLDDTYQSTVPGLYVVGETAGTASINLAMRSGRQAVEFIANQLKFNPRTPAPEIYDVAIIGCGPAGISATCTAKASGLSYLALEKETAAGTIRNYPRGKFVQSTAIEVAEYGSFFMEGDTSKEVLLKEWERILAETGITINEREEVSAIRAREGYFEILTSASRSYQARYAVLAIGLRGSPRRLKLAGETPDRVFYSLIEPSEFQNRRLLVVGGGNAGTEVAQALADPQLHNIVSYSFRTPALGPPVTPENAEKISQLQRQGLITIYPASALTGLAPGKVVLEPFGAARSGELSAGANAIVITEPTELDNDCVFAMLGAELPTRFMESIGIQMERKGR